MQTDNGQFIGIYDFVRVEDNQKTISENFNKLVIQSANYVINPSYK